MLLPNFLYKLQFHSKLKVHSNYDPLRACKSHVINRSCDKKTNNTKLNPNIVDQRVLGNALQRISELERIGQHQLHTDPPRAEAANQTNATNAVEEL